MPVQRLNHAVLYVRDAQQSAEFYQDVLGFVRLMDSPRAVFMRAPGSTNDHDLGLFSVGATAGPSPAGRDAVGLYHLAWEVDTLDELERLAGVLSERGALVGASDHGTTKALYARDPDGIEFEVSWLVPADRLDEVGPHRGVLPLDLQAEKRRYGGSTLGGIAVSTPAPATVDERGLPTPAL
jgi:catechol-2,3-dioxygenase